jgi:hypothetical protein
MSGIAAVQATLAATPIITLLILFVPCLSG